MDSCPSWLYVRLHIGLCGESSDSVFRKLLINWVYSDCSKCKLVSHRGERTYKCYSCNINSPAPSHPEIILATPSLSEGCHSNEAMAVNNAMHIICIIQLQSRRVYSSVLQYHHHHQPAVLGWIKWPEMHYYLHLAVAQLALPLVGCSVSQSVSQATINKVRLLCVAVRITVV